MKYEARPPCPVERGRCARHDVRVGPSRMCLVGHLEALALGGGGPNARHAAERLRDMGREVPVE